MEGVIYMKCTVKLENIVSFYCEMSVILQYTKKIEKNNSLTFLSFPSGRSGLVIDHKMIAVI